MIVIADTNVLARIVTEDDKLQTEAAFSLFLSATKFVIPTIVFCELAWLLSRSPKYRKPTAFISNAIRGFLGTKNVAAENDVVLAGLRMLDDGGDFADGVVQYTGSLLAGAPATFASFDQDAVRRLSARGITAMVPLPST